MAAFKRRRGLTEDRLASVDSERFASSASGKTAATSSLIDIPDVSECPASVTAATVELGRPFPALARSASWIERVLYPFPDRVIEQLSAL